MKTAKPEAENKVIDKTGDNTVVETTDMGEVRIHENVISALVRRATVSVAGVSRLAGSSLVDNIAEIVGSRRMQERSIAVDMTDENRVRIDVKINVKFGFKVPVVASAIQKAVIEQVEESTGISVIGVNVIVQEIEAEEVPAADDNAAVGDVII